MNTCKETEKIIYYKSTDFNWIRGVKIGKVILCSILVFALFVTSTLSAYAEHSKRLPISQSVRLTLRIPPRGIIRVNEEKVVNKSVSIDSKDLLNASSSPNEGHLFTDKVIRSGVELTRVTKVFSEGLYLDL